MKIQGLVEQSRELGDQTGQHLDTCCFSLLLCGEEFWAEESLSVLVDPSVDCRVDRAGENHCEWPEIFGTIAGELSDKTTEVQILLLYCLAGKLGRVHQGNIHTDNLEPFKDSREL